VDRFIKQTPSTTIKVKNNIVYKIFNRGFPRHITKEWEKDYNDLRDINSHFIKILEYNRTKNYISMPYVPLQIITERFFVKQNLYQTLQLIKDMMLFSEERNGFIHTDLHCENLMVNTDTGNITVLDPDSFYYKSIPDKWSEWYNTRTKYEIDETIRRLMRYWFHRKRNIYEEIKKC
tara:strand:+ start:1340 stop:1870 length:531 start_codon:yes stop_codon:yes gene_type:complete